MFERLINYYGSLRDKALTYFSRSEPKRDCLLNRLPPEVFVALERSASGSSKIPIFEKSPGGNNLLNRLDPEVFRVLERSVRPKKRPIDYED